MDFNRKYSGGVVTNDQAYHGVEHSQYGAENFNRGPTPRDSYQSYDRYGSDRYSTDRFNEKRGRKFDHMGIDLPGPDGMSDYEPDQHRDKDHRGRGPKNYSRSDDRILEDVCQRLTDSHEVNAENIEVKVEDGCVTLDGSVESKQAKYLADDIAEYASGVREVCNNLKVP